MKVGNAPLSSFLALALPHLCLTLVLRVLKKTNAFDLCQNTLDLPAQRETICTGGNVSILPK